MALATRAALAIRATLAIRAATTGTGADGVADISVAIAVGVAPLKDVGTATGIGPVGYRVSIVLHGGMFVPLQVLGTGMPPRAKSGEFDGSATLGNSRSDCGVDSGATAGDGERAANEGDGT